MLFDCMTDVLSNAHKARLGPKIDIAAPSQRTFPPKLFGQICFQALEFWIGQRSIASDADQSEDEDEDEDEDDDGSDSTCIKEVRFCR